jgi:predicted acetyltransferase
MNYGMELVRPTTEHLPSYVQALERGWSPDTQRLAAAQDELARIVHDPAAFLAEQDDPEGLGPPVVLPDGSVVPRLPGYTRWMWDGEFCGRISVRWQPGTTSLPPTCLGHIGYSVVPWKQRRRHATNALRLILPDVRLLGLPYVELSTDAQNLASRRVIETNGGVLIEEFIKPASHGNRRSLLYRISLH